VVATWIAVTFAPVLALRWLHPVTSAFMVRHCWDGTLGGLLDCRVFYRWVDWDSISPLMAIAAVASEDQKFLEHSGFDFASIAEAVEEGARQGHLRGASTISQQVAKNLFLWPGRSLARKGLEDWFTGLIELTWQKRRILEVYLNVCEFGFGVYGVGAASEFYFSKTPSELNSEESALLAAVLPNPRRMRVDRPGPYTLERRDWIVEQMRLLGPNYLRALSR